MMRPGVIILREGTDTSQVRISCVSSLMLASSFLSMTAPSHVHIHIHIHIVYLLGDTTISQQY